MSKFWVFKLFSGKITIVIHFEWFSEEKCLSFELIQKPSRFDRVIREDRISIQIKTYKPWKG